MWQLGAGRRLLATDLQLLAVGLWLHVAVPSRWGMFPNQPSGESGTRGWGGSRGGLYGGERG